MNVPPAVGRLFLPSFTFAALLVLVFVGPEAFSPPEAMSPFGALMAAEGEPLIQVLYLSVFALAAMSAIQRHGFAAFGAIAFFLGLLLAWCLASAGWAAEPQLALRRAGLEVMLVLALLFSVDTIGAGRAFKLLRVVLAAVLAVNFLSIHYLAVARHLPGEGTLAGDWRGLYGHKDIAGAVSAITTIAFLFSRNGRYNWIGILVAAAATGFLVMTHDKVSLAILPLALAAGGIYHLTWHDSLSRAIVAAVAALLLAALSVLAVLKAASIAHLLEDPAELAGRTANWAAQWRIIHAHPMLGTGFGSAQAIGGNGYLHILASLGGIGFALALAALIGAPLRWFWELNWEQSAFKPLLFALFAFLALHNVMAADFLNGANVTWVTFVLMLAALKETHRAAARY